MARRIRNALHIAISDENLDLYILGAVSFAFTVLSATGVSDFKVLSAMILALLTFLAFSQVKSRKLMQRMNSAHRAASSILLRREFPPDLINRRANASDVLLVGLTMTRTVQSMLSDLPSILRNDGRVRVLVLDPTNEPLMLTADQTRSHRMGTEHLRQRILHTLDDLTTTLERHGGKLEVRVSSSIPTSGFNCLDATKANGLICVQHYEFHPNGEASPIASFSRDDEPWYGHFTAEAERLWDAGTGWPLSIADMQTRARRPIFSDQWGSDLVSALDIADKSLITGVARNTFLTSNFNRLEARLQRGQSMRFLLMDPLSPAVEIAAERYYAERSSETARQRIQASLRLLSELRSITGGDLTVRLTKHPLSSGLIAVEPNSTNAVIYVEYYTFQAPGEPKFVMRPQDGFGYDSLLGEGEALWQSAEPYELDSTRAH